MDRWRGKEVFKSVSLAQNKNLGNPLVSMIMMLSGHYCVQVHTPYKYLSMYVCMYVHMYVHTYIRISAVGRVVALRSLRLMIG